MNYKQEKKKISGYEVQVTKFPGRQGLALKFKLLKMVLPIIPKDETSGADVMSNIAKALTEHTDEEIIDIILELLGQTLVDNKPVGEEVHFDMVFSGDFGLLYEVITYILEVNYKSFLDMIGMGEKVKKGTKSLTPKRNIK
jgi:hypothetical protein